MKKFVHAFTGGEMSKGDFPYECIRTAEDLNRQTFPSHHEFFSCLKGANISVEAYNECMDVWNSLQQQNMLEFLKAYCIRDTIPMLVAAEKMINLYFEKFGIDCLKQTASFQLIPKN